MERDTNTPEIKALRLGGVDLRNGRHAIKPGFGDRVFGLFPRNNNLLQRIPGKFTYRYLQGREILGGIQVFDGAGSVFIQNGDRIDLYTLDDFLNRSTTYSLTHVIPTDETFGRAVLAQIETNTAFGGSAQGYLSGTDSSSAADTFYSRRLTDALVNETVGGLATVKTFTASTGGGGVASTAGQFVLEPGLYSISVEAEYLLTALGSTVMGLYNVTDAQFEVYPSISEPILANPIRVDFSGSRLGIAVIEAMVLVSSADKTFELRHKFSTTGNARALEACGSHLTMATANVNGAAARNTYCIVEIIRYS